MRPSSRPSSARRLPALFALVATLAATVAYAGAPVRPPSNPAEASPAHERLKFFEGAWTIVETTPEENFSETCAWLPEGRRHMVCRSRITTRAGWTEEGMSIFSIDPATGDTLYTGFRAGGAVAPIRGVVHGEGWQFNDEEGSGAERFRTRITITPTAKGFDFLQEVSNGDGPWSKAGKVTYLRKK